MTKQLSTATTSLWKGFIGVSRLFLAELIFALYDQLFTDLKSCGFGPASGSKIASPVLLE